MNRRGRHLRGLRDRRGDTEAQRPQEGVVDAGIRPLRRLDRTHGLFCAGVTLDALYTQTPFLEAVRALGRHVVARLKDERYAVVQDAAGGSRPGKPPCSSRSAEYPGQGKGAGLVSSFQSSPHRPTGVGGAHKALEFLAGYLSMSRVP